MAGAAITLRTASAGDAGTVHRLLRRLASATGKAEALVSRPEDIARYIGARPGFECLLAFEGDVPVGLALYFYEFSTWRGTPGVYIQDLYVEPGLRGQGLGRQLVEAVKSAASSWDSRYVKLAVHGDNPGAIAFYRSLGFTLSEDEQVLTLVY